MERVRLIFLWLAVVLVSTQNVCGNHKAVGTVIRSENFTLFEENGKVGLKDEQGDVLIPAIYDAIGWSDGRLSIVDKVVGYQSDGLWGLIHTSNKIVTAPEFLDLRPGEGSFIVAQKKSRLSQRPSFGIINTAGKTVIPFEYDGLHLSGMRAVVMSRSGTKFLFGLSDLSHKILIPIKFQRIYSLGSLRFAVENFEDKTAIFSDEGGRVTNFTIDSISAFKKDYAIVYQNQRQGLIDRTGQFVLPPKYGSVKLSDDGTIHTRETDSWFFLDGENNLVREYKADAIKPLSTDHYAIMGGGKVTLTNNHFTPVVEHLFSSVTNFQNGMALFRSGGKTGVITDSGKILVPAHYQSLVIDQNVFRACRDDGDNDRCDILDNQGREMTEKHYEYIGPFNGTFYPVRNRGYWGAVGRDGKQVITCVHDSLVRQKGNYVVVKFKGEYGILDLDENWIVTPQPNPLAMVNSEAYFEFSGNTTFLKSFSGDIIYFSDNKLEYDERGYVRENLSSGAYWIISLNGIVVDRSNQPDDTEIVFPESEGFRAIRKDGKFGFIDSDGRLRIANRYEAVQPFSGGRAAIRIQNKWGFIDKEENLLVQPVFDHVEDFRGGLAIVTRDNLSGIIDESGEVVLPMRYDAITLNNHSRFRLRQGKLFGLANASGSVVIHPKYDDIIDTGNGYVIVQRNGRFGLVTLRGVSTIPMIYDGLTFDPHRKQYLAVKRSSWKTFKSQQSTVDGPQ